MQKSITVCPDGYVLVGLREGREVTRQVPGEIILDLNDQGNWVHGFEIVGGFVDFSIEKAVRPFNPELPDPSKAHRRTIAVTYDPEADAAFFFMEYEPSVAKSPKNEWHRLMTVSQGVNPTAIYGLDEDGGLVWVKIPTADVSGPMEQFLHLLRK